MSASAIAATYAGNDSIAGANPDATISPAVLAIARTLASLAPRAPTLDVSELPRIVVASTEERAAGQLAPDIVVTRELGVGGMGCVHLARQTVFDRTVAVKRVRPDRLCDAAVRALLAEARLSSTLDHPNIVPVHMLGQSETGEPLLVMKRVEGIVWRELVLKPRPDDTNTDRLGRHLEILRQVCNAAEFAHRQGVIHRDIKLENVMVGELGEVYLLDWGIATRVDEPTSSDLAGTPAYMAPEMLPGAGPVTARTDVYLLGSTLHEILTGQTRHQGASMWGVLASVQRSDPFVYESSVPSELAAIANRATARNPGERYSSALAFSEAVGEFQKHRASLDLSLGAERLLGELRATVQEVASGRTAATCSRARRTAMECTFGFRQALRAWAENPSARDGLRACTEATIAFELTERNAPGAELLLAELHAPKPELVAELERLKVALAEEAQAPAKLAHMARNQDAFLDGSTGGKSPAVVSAVIAVICIGLSLVGVRMRGAGFVAYCSVMMLVAVATVTSQRATLMYNLASTRRTLATTTVFPFILAAALIGYAQGSPVVQAVQIAFLGQALMAALVGITVSPTVLVGVPFYLAALVALVIWPRDALFDLGVLAAMQAVVNRVEAYLVWSREAARVSATSRHELPRSRPLEEGIATQ